MTDRRRVLVTGASRGIGRAICRRLHDESYRVTGIDVEPAEVLEGEEHTCDLTDFEAARALITDLARDEAFYAVVNNAATFPTGLVDATSVEDMDAAMQLNLNAVLVCTQAVLTGMRALGGGRIVNLSSRAALGKISRTAYSAAKAGVIGMSRTWALELAQANITVNVVAPGPIATESFLAANPAERPETKALVESVPMMRMGAPEEVAHAIAFLLDDRAGFITGQTLHVDGGLTIGANGI